MNEGNLDGAQAEIPEEVLTSDDANIAGVRALIHNAKNGNKNTEWKRWVERAATGSNVLIKKHISTLINFSPPSPPSAPSLPPLLLLSSYYSLTLVKYGNC